jgi:hypothetical protein
MADPTLSVSSLNPFGSIGLGSLSSMGVILLVIAVAVVIIALIGALIYIYSVRKQYYIKIHAFRLVGNSPTRVAIYCAKEIPMGMAGDKLWRVASSGMLKFKVLKWLPIGKKQTAPNEFWYWIREDGEWINFSMDDIDAISKKMNVRFVQEDMRLQRLATDRLLEQRLMNKTFWDKYGNMIMTLIFFLVIAVCMVIIFYQFSKVVDKLSPLVANIDTSLQVVMRTCGMNLTSNGEIQGGGLIPVR